MLEKLSINRHPIGHHAHAEALRTGSAPNSISTHQPSPLPRPPEPATPARITPHRAPPRPSRSGEPPAKPPPPAPLIPSQKP
ncbi:hypothetical protein BRADI_3g53015v3 [Brachypodium distachyon]|uniref:Uncharacterized protein n=1 Tax=Brachypodium distachyon TaxID=15368 RepID=A0A2K2D4U7_BRADI|nr:hypothetical protein BRADI_3g53015v3 [Brachypodium distachyon]